MSAPTTTDLTLWRAAAAVLTSSGTSEDRAERIRSEFAASLQEHIATGPPRSVEVAVMAEMLSLLCADSHEDLDERDNRLQRGIEVLWESIRP